ncbi:MAG TPA: hypothetical protein VHD83_23710 [Puia sp.]|nr:hypothetical protein [Puia sp.]
MMELQQIDQALTAQLDLLKESARGLALSPICEFELKEESLNKIPWQDHHYPGIYFIEIKNDNKYTSFADWASAFQNSWMDERYRKKFVANPKKSRISRHTELSEWIPLYIGKSRNISNRVQEHINLGLDKPTFAMKLKVRDHLKEDRFRLSTIRVDIYNYDWIMPILEKSFRDRFHPIVGRQ